MSTSPRLTTDCHTHVGVDASFYLAGWLPYASSAQDLIGHLDSAGIDRAVCFPNPTPSAFDPWEFARTRDLVQLPGTVPYARENAVLVAEIDKVDVDRRLLPFAMFDPSRDVAAQLDHLSALAGSIRGMTCQPTLLKSPVRDLLGPSRALMEFAESHDLPVLIHSAVDPADRWSQAFDCLDVAAAHPHVRFAFAHSLRFDLPALEAARDLDNVWVDCSAHLLHCELALLDAPAVASRERRVPTDYRSPVDAMTAVHEILRGRYVWGSDSPYQSWSDDDFSSVHAYSEEAAVLHALSEDVRDSMLVAAPEAWLFGTATEPAL